jgi:phosphohistidine phosphatase
MGLVKKIHLIRHAKSSWDDPSLNDIERPLNPKGIKSCGVMASHILDAGCQFTSIFCSPAVRAQSSIELISQSIPEISIQWQTEQDLYCFDSGSLYDWCRVQDDSLSELVIVGHNPALTDFCNELSSSDLKNIPTCGYVQLTALSKSSWQEISETGFELTSFIKPKAFMS